MSANVSLTMVFVAPLQFCVARKIRLALQSHHGAQGYQGQIGKGNSRGRMADSFVRSGSSSDGLMAMSAVCTGRFAVSKARGPVADADKI